MKQTENKYDKFKELIYN